MKCPGEADFKLKPHKIVRNMLSELKLKCRNVGYGCKAILEYEKLEVHEEVECKFEKIECPNKEYGCPVIINRDQLEKHIRDHCEFHRVECKFC